MIIKEKVNILLVGTWQEGEAFIELFHKSENINVLGVVDSDTSSVPSCGDSFEIIGGLFGGHKSITSASVVA